MSNVLFQVSRLTFYGAYSPFAALVNRTAGK
jgi:hypothetical protein